MQRYNQRMLEQLKIRQQQEKARLPKIQRSEGKTRMAMYKKSLHIHSSGSAAEQREKIKQVGSCKRHQGWGLDWGGNISPFWQKGERKKATVPKLLTCCRESEVFAFVVRGVVFSAARVVPSVEKHSRGFSFFPI